MEVLLSKASTPIKYFRAQKQKQRQLLHEHYQTMLPKNPLKKQRKISDALGFL